MLLKKSSCIFILLCFLLASFIPASFCVRLSLLLCRCDAAWTCKWLSNTLIHTLYCWMLSKEVSSTILKVFGMTWPGIEPRPLVNTLPTRPMSRSVYIYTNAYLSPWWAGTWQNISTLLKHSNKVNDWFSYIFHMHLQFWGSI